MSHDYANLITAAITARENAYAPYSRFKVGAAILSPSGKIYLGCNVENASFGLANCAERTALFTAIASGERRFVAIAVVTAAPLLTPPCGACRQALAEFMPDDAHVILANLEGFHEIVAFDQILPRAFRSFNP